MTTKRKPATPLNTGVYFITVSHRNRAALERALERPANADVFPERLWGGYTDGSTSWAVAVRSPATAQRQRDILWQSGLHGDCYIDIREATVAERDSL